MGRIQANEFAGLVNENVIDLYSALVWHLTSNHYPPMDKRVIPIAQKAIRLAKEDIWDEELEVPSGRMLSVGRIVRELHLEDFI